MAGRSTPLWALGTTLAVAAAAKPSAILTVLIDDLGFADTQVRPGAAASRRMMCSDTRSPAPVAAAESHDTHAEPGGTGCRRDRP